jgi:hypothetical protein
MYFIGIRIFFLVVKTGVNIVEKTIRKEFLFLLPISLLGINLEINAFELLSEGAMGSVSATTDLTIDTNKPNDSSSKDQSTFEQLLRINQHSNNYHFKRASKLKSMKLMMSPP